MVFNLIKRKSLYKSKRLAQSEPFGVCVSAISMPINFMVINLNQM